MKSNSQKDNILRRSMISSIIFVVIVLVVFYFVFKDNNYREVYSILKMSNKFYLFLAIFCMACFSVCEALNIYSSLKLLGNKLSFIKAYKYALAGFFVASITPSSSGGDPMQLYLMSKDKIKISHGAITLLVKLLAFQFVVIFLAIFGFFTSHHLFLNSLGNLKYIIFLGIFLNVLVFTLYFLMVFFKPVILFLVEIISSLLGKLKVKRRDDIIKNILKSVDEYSQASIFLKKNKVIFVKLFLTTLIQFLLYYSIPYFVYLSLGFNDYSILTFIALQSILFVSVSSLPFPGAVGVSEATFLRIYKSMFPRQILGSAMVITRFINFYIFVLYSGMMLLIIILKDNMERKS